MPATRQSGRVMRIALIVLGVLVAIAIVCEILGWPFLRKPLENLASRQLNREVRIEAPFWLHLLGGITLDAGGLWIASPPQFKAPHLIDAENIKVGLRYADLIGRANDEPLNIKLLQVERMDAYMLRNDDGATWQFSEKPSETPTPFPNFETLVVQDGTALVQDTLTDADLEMRFQTEEGSESGKAVSVVKAEGTFRQHPIKGNLVTPGFLPAAKGEESHPIPVDAWVNYGGVYADFKGTVADIADENDIRGNFTIKGPSLGIAGDLFNITLPTTTEFTIKGDARRENNLLVVNIEKAQVGRSDLSGQFSFDTSGEKILMKGDLNSSNFVLADLGPTFGTRAEDGSEIELPEGRIFPDRPLNLPALNKFNADISLDFQRVDLGRVFEVPIAPFKADLSLNSGKLSLAKIDARTAEGSLAGTIAVDAHALGASGNENEDDKSRPRPEWMVDLDWKDINLAKWIKAREPSEEGEPAEYITGILNGRMDLQGRGNSTAELLGSFDGDISAYINNGQISHLIIEALGLDLAQALGLVIKGDELLSMRCAVVDMQSKSGVVRPEVALIDTPVTLVLMDGKVSLQQEQLDLRLVAKPENVSPFTARSPILITGTFANPDIQPKAAPIAARVLGGIALAFINPLAAIIPFIDPGTGDHSPCGEALREFNAKNGKGAANGSGSRASGAKGYGSGGSRAVESGPTIDEPSDNPPSANEPDQDEPGSARPAEDSPVGNVPVGSRGIPGHGAE